MFGGVGGVSFNEFENEINLDTNKINKRKEYTRRIVEARAVNGNGGGSVFTPIVI